MKYLGFEDEGDKWLLLKASGFAEAAHIKQKRKYTGNPYYWHVLDVAHIYTDFCENPKVEVAAACLLHDTIEDCGITKTELDIIFGSKIANLVMEVTDVSRPEMGNRKFRKELDLAHLAECSIDAANIKLADMIDNTQSIMQYDEEFAKIYIPEKIKILEVLEPKNPDKELLRQLKGKL